jgi:acyl transferase domain-containing protein
VGASAVEHRVQAVGRLFARRLFSGEFGPAGPAPEGWAEAAVAALPEIQEYTMVGSLGNFLAAVVAQTFDLGGPAYTVDAACASGLVALHDAAQHLRSGDCGMAIVGGVYLALSPDAMVAFSRVGAISRTDSCRPFDARADGFVLGEGAGALVVKRLADARRDGDRVHAIIRGVGASNDGRGAGPMTPGERGQTRALERAYADAGVAAASVGFIEAHGTATPVGDLTEARALAAIRARGGEPCAIGSIKGNIGHAMSAAGIAGLIKAALVVAHGEIPPQAGFERERVELGLADAGLFVPRQRVELRGSRGEPRRAGVSSFGFGGTNVHVVLEGVERAGLPRGETT